MAREWRRCSVEGCSGEVAGTLASDGSSWGLCASHYAMGMQAINEVMTHLLETGETYLPGTSATVLVEYTVNPTDEAVDRLRKFRELETRPRELVGETLYRVEWDEHPDGNWHFANIGYWTDPQAFRDFFTAPSGVQPALDPTFEAKPRRRGWLTRDRNEVGSP